MFYYINLNIIISKDIAVGNDSVKIDVMNPFFFFKVQF